MEKLEKEIKEILCESLDISMSELENNQIRLSQDLGMDSLDIVELSIKLEGFYSIHISDGELDNWSDIQSVIDTVQKILKG